VLNPFTYDKLIEIGNENEYTPKIPVELARQYSQAGEDLIIQSLIYRLNYFKTNDHKKSFELNNLRYLEIGANHPIATSSTYLFYLKGASGILVEPNPDLADLLRNVRPNDEVLSVACVDNDQLDGQLHISEASELSSLIPESPGRWINTFKIIKTIKCATTHVNNVAKIFWDKYANGKSTFLSIDCEGLDFKLISALDLERFPFDIIQIEPGEPLAPKNLERIEGRLLKEGYLLLCMTEVNAIFINRSSFKIL
jgi:FkbM family methyltransferase